jgi:hypothetical protein
MEIDKMSLDKMTSVTLNYSKKTNQASSGIVAYFQEKISDEKYFSD